MPQTNEEKLAYERTWRASNREKMREYARLHRANNPEMYARYKKKHNAAKRAWCKANPATHAARRRKQYFQQKYGLTLEQVETMLASQGFRCATCKDDITGNTKRQHVDHCHATGRIRGVLCRECNLALGHVRDSPTTLMAMAKYLEARNTG